MAERWRVVMICSIAPMADTYVPALRDLGHDVVAILAPRRGKTIRRCPSTWSSRRYSVPAGLDLLFARDKHSIEPLLRAYEPDLTVCSGFPWKIPQAALDVPRLGSINLHPALLPRHRGPIPLAWALRDGDPVWGMTWHRMDAELDTGNILAQGSVPIEDDDVDIEQFGPSCSRAGWSCSARARASGRRRPRRPAARGGSLVGRALRGRRVRPRRLVAAGPLHPRPGARLAPRVRLRRDPGAQAELGGEQVVLRQTRLTDPGGDAVRVECGDGPIWVVASEPL